MRTGAAILRSNRGFTLVEVIITVTILVILVSVLGASYETVKAKIRYSQMKGDMDGIAQAAYDNYTSKGSIWAPGTLPGDPPIFVNASELKRWPAPPCPGWAYGWDNWDGLPGYDGLVRVTVRRTTDLSAIFGYCIQTLNNTCQGPDPMGGSPADVTTLSSHYLYCNE